MTLIFSARTGADVIDRDRFAGLAGAHPRFRFIRTVTRGAGPPSHGRIPGLLPTFYRDLSGHDVFVAGAPGFVLACSIAPTRSERRPPKCTWRCSSRSRNRGGPASSSPAGWRERMAGGGTPPIYTKTSDDGTTGPLFGGRVSKADPVVEAGGTLDEAVAALDLGRACLRDCELQAIVLDLQRGPFAAAAEIAANPRARDRLVPGIYR